jgi:hypothetical protein
VEGRRRPYAIEVGDSSRVIRHKALLNLDAMFTDAAPLSQ